MNAGLWQIVDGTQVAETFLNTPDRGLVTTGPIRKQTVTDCGFAKQLEAARAAMARR